LSFCIAWLRCSRQLVYSAIEKSHDTLNDSHGLIGAEHVTCVGDDLGLDVWNELPRSIECEPGIVQDFFVADEQQQWHFEILELFIAKHRPERDPRAEIHGADDQLLGFQIIGLVSFDGL
jgi:hypothetical protein